MLTATRAFSQNATSAPLLPQPTSLQPIWDWGVKPREGSVIMIAGRPGHQKSGFALFWVAEMGLPTLYLSADMTGFEATSRLVGMQTRQTSEEVEEKWGAGDTAPYMEALRGLDITFRFGTPIRWQGLEDELNAYMEVHNQWPSIVVIDNLMDIEGCETDYVAQSEAMQDITSWSRETGITFIVLHHATDKSQEAKADPGRPPSRGDIKNGLAEKPQLVLTVALEPEFSEFRVACVKQRSGRNDPSGHEHVQMQAYPEYTRFGPKNRFKL